VLQHSPNDWQAVESTISADLNALPLTDKLALALHKSRPAYHTF